MLACASFLHILHTHMHDACAHFLFIYAHILFKMHNINRWHISLRYFSFQHKGHKWFKPITYVGIHAIPLTPSLSFLFRPQPNGGAWPHRALKNVFLTPHCRSDLWMSVLVLCFKEAYRYVGGGSKEKVLLRSVLVLAWLGSYWYPWSVFQRRTSVKWRTGMESKSYRYAAATQAHTH